jgi:hypothetical protein
MQQTIASRATEHVVPSHSTAAAFASTAPLSQFAASKEEHVARGVQHTSASLELHTAAAHSFAAELSTRTLLGQSAEVNVEHFARGLQQTAVSVAPQAAKTQVLSATSGLSSPLGQLAGAMLEHFALGLQQTPPSTCGSQSLPAQYVVSADWIRAALPQNHDSIVEHLARSAQQFPAGQASPTWVPNYDEVLHDTHRHRCDSGR